MPTRRKLYPKPRPPQWPLLDGVLPAALYVPRYGAYTDTGLQNLGGIGDVIAGLKDLFERGSDVVQTTTSQRGVLVSGPSGLPVLRLDGTDDNYATAAMFNALYDTRAGLGITLPYTIGILLKTNLGAGLTYQTANGPRIAISGTTGIISLNNGGNFVSTLIISAGVWSTIVAVVNGASSVLRLNGTDQSGATGVGANNLLVSRTQTLFASAALANPMSADIGGFLYFRGGASAAQRLIIENELKRPYGL